MTSSEAEQPDSDLACQTYRIEVWSRQRESAIGQNHVSAAHHLGITSLSECAELRVYFLRGNLSLDDAHRLSRELLADPVTEAFGVFDEKRKIEGKDVFFPVGDHVIDVTLLPGVTDPAAENLLRAAHLLGIGGLERTATGQRYVLTGHLGEDDLHRLAVEVFSNPVIQRYAVDQPIAPPFFAYQQADDHVEIISVRSADDEALRQISATRRLALDLAEMQAIRAYFEHVQRDPTDVELEMLAQTWSEHCVHKTFKAVIEIRDLGSEMSGTAQSTQSPVVDGLLRTYIRAATERVNKPWVRSAFVDNAGIIAFNDQWDLAFKVETHNHPSALEPFGGANTGVGGVIRDVLGVSARPIANTDVLCFGPQDLPQTHLPTGVLHPRRIADGVVKGVEDYGNKMGIPTVNGAILYHPGYTANPLVFCGCLGILPRGSHPSQPQPGDLVIVIGGRTGRDGLRGATFSSMEMDQGTGDIAGSAVQIGHPIHEKQVMEAVLRARDERLYHALTDCGAGGLSSAVGELGKDLGVRVQLDAVPLKYPGLRPWEVWLSEAQERMVLAVPPEHWPRLQAICDGQNIEAVCIGTFEATGCLQLFYGERIVAELDMNFLHDGIPRRRLEAVFRTDWRLEIRDGMQPNLQTLISNHQSPDLTQALLALLAHPNIRSKEQVVRVYDHEVQGATAIKPLVGAANHGPSDASVLIPINDCRLPIADSVGAQSSIRNHQSAIRGIALSAGICPQFTELDPYAMAWAAIDEAMRNAVAVGADPDQIAILDNFCWGNPNLPDRLGSLVRCAQGCYDAAVAYGVPFISGKDSLNNEYTAEDGHKHAIPGTLLISALGIVPDVRRAVSMDLKQTGNLLYVLGDTRAELGGSHYSIINFGVPIVDSESVAEQSSIQNPPQPVPDAIERLRALHRAIMAGLVQACHDCSEGGLGVALAESCLAGRLGAEIDLTAIPGAREIPHDDVALFSESLSRFIVEVGPTDAEAFEAAMSGMPYARIGYVTDSGELRIRGQLGQAVISANVSELEKAWRGFVEQGSARAGEMGRKGATVQESKDTFAPPLPCTSAPAHARTLASRRVLILHATGSNRDRDAALACELAGGAPEIVHVNQLLSGERKLLDYGMLVIPGGFSYGDDLGAGTLWALDLRHRLGEDVGRFIAAGRPVLGICNGFQALVKAGLLPGAEAFTTVNQEPNPSRTVTLAPNASAQFECRWVYLRPDPASHCLFTTGLDDLIYCPVAHGEGRVAARDERSLATLQAHHLIALSYVNADGSPTQYPDNPNGSALDIAGLTNSAGNLLGLMPHPENHIFPWQHPRWQRNEGGMVGLRLFENGVKSC